MISSFIFAGAERAPERLAIVCDDQRLTYGQFAQAIEAMVQRFAAAGVGGEGYALVACGDLLECWIIMLALRELGLTTMPVMSLANAEAARLDEVRFIVAASHEPWDGLQALAQRMGCPLVRAKWGGALARPVETGRQRVAKIGEHVVQTSGTTGSYKKVLMARSFEAAFLAERARLHSCDAHTRMALFNFGAWTGVGYRATGSVWLAGGAVIFSQRSGVHGAMHEPELTNAVALPHQLRALLVAPEDAYPCRPEMLMRFGGGTPTGAEIEMAARRITPRLCMSIGSTEAQVFAETPLVTAEDRRWHKLLPHRLPQIVDDADNPLPVGEVGHVRVPTYDGPQGYLADDAATATFFKPGWFYPGDLAVIRADGRMALMGRVTDVINVLGDKRSPEPYEDALREALGVAGVCVFSRQDAAAEEEVYVVIESRVAIDMAKLERILPTVLYGFPRAQVRYLLELPRNANGKVLRLEVQRRVTLAPA